ncbi:MAG: hypothetical protein ACXW6R_13910 [Candidatus Binatia bacterium]
MIFYDNNTIPIVVGLGAPQVKRRWQDLSPYLEQFPGQPRASIFAKQTRAIINLSKAQSLPIFSAKNSMATISIKQENFYGKPIDLHICPDTGAAPRLGSGRCRMPLRGVTRKG